MHDTIAFEQHGIPATTILTQVFTNTAIFQFRAKGMAGHPYIALPHPISNLTSDDMRGLTRRYIDDVVRQLIA